MGCCNSLKEPSRYVLVEVQPGKCVQIRRCRAWGLQVIPYGVYLVAD